MKFLLFQGNQVGFGITTGRMVAGSRMSVKNAAGTSRPICQIRATAFVSIVFANHILGPKSVTNCIKTSNKQVESAGPA